MSFAERLYSRSPTRIQNALVSLYGAYWRWIRFGPGASRLVEEFQDREGFDSGQWDAWIRSRLETLLEVAVRHVPHYRNNWGPNQIRAAKSLDLSGLPILEKDLLRKSPQSFVRADESTRGDLVFHTSGSTGTPLAIHWKTSACSRTCGS